MQKTSDHQDVKVVVQRKQLGEATYPISELAALIAAGEVGDMIPTRLESENSYRALKFHPIWSEVSEAVKKAVPGKKAAGSAKKGKLGLILLSALGLAAVAAVVICLPMIKAHMPDLASFKPAEKEAPMDIARKHMYVGEYEPARAIFKELMSGEATVLPEVEYEIRILQALMALEAGKARSAFVVLRKVDPDASIQTTDAAFHPIFEELAGTPSMANYKKLAVFHKQHADYYPATRVMVWALGGGVKSAQDKRKQRDLLRVMALNYPSVSNQLRYAEVSFAHRAYGESAKAYEQLLKLQPNDADVLFTLGKVNLELNRQPEAMAYFEQAVAINPDLPVFLAP